MLTILVLVMQRVPLVGPLLRLIKTTIFVLYGEIPEEIRKQKKEFITEN